MTRLTTVRTGRSSLLPRLPRSTPSPDGTEYQSRQSTKLLQILNMLKAEFIVVGKAARFLGPAQLLRIEGVEPARPGPDEVLLRVRGAGICHSDIRVLEGIGYPVKPPLTIGHEIAGEIVEVGSRVDSHRIGDRVVVYFGGTCNRCRYCLEGRGSRCLYPAERPIYGMTVDGGFAEYCKVEAVNLVSLPENVGWEFGATLGCAGVTAYHAVTYV